MPHTSLQHLAQRDANRHKRDLTTQLIALVP